MELLYNPTLMSEAEIKATFVARQGLVDELLDLVARQPEGAGVQHVVIIAPRGMGKTTALMMVQFGVADRRLTSLWQVVKFCEESYSINDLADLWLEVINLLGADTGDMELLRRGDQLKATYGDSGDLHEAAFALLKDWAREHGKRLLLLVDNLDLILEQINDERDNARLRDVLMNDGTVMLIGAASTFFREARAYEQPLYNFFKIYDLAPLTRSEIRDLLRQRAAADEKPNFEDFLEKNTARLRVLEHFTGGNPRLVLMLYRVVVRSEVTEVLQGLEKLLDEVTPYYKAKIESLPPQQRKILDHIARVSGRTWEGVTPGAIAHATRLSPNQVSAQLRRLSELGYVRVADLRERASWYTLSEPLYALYHQMRFGRQARQRMQWLVNFMKLWYEAEELGPECERLALAFRQNVAPGPLLKAGGVLESGEYPPSALLAVACARYFEPARRLIAKSGLEGMLFPLARALDYLLTGDEALIEKLSPEVRGFVEEIVQKFGPAKPPPTTRARRKPRTGVRGRIRKQLS
jgi:DNA-binding transcriptional ArsR family regulator